MAYESASLEVGIHKGRMIRIHPSQGYQGIDEGLVKIVNILDSQENPRVKEELQLQIDTMDLDTTDATDNEIITGLYESKWVEYEYVSTTSPDGIIAGDTFLLDLETFLDHTTRH